MSDDPVLHILLVAAAFFAGLVDSMAGEAV